MILKSKLNYSKLLCSILLAALLQLVVVCCGFCGDLTSVYLVPGEKFLFLAQKKSSDRFKPGLDHM